MADFAANVVANVKMFYIKKSEHFTLITTSLISNIKTLSFERVGAKFESSSMSDYFYSREWMDRHIDPINNCVSREFKEGVDVFIAFSSNQTYFIEGKPCYFLVQDVKTENNVTREPYLAIFTESSSKVIIIYG